MSTGSLIYDEYAPRQERLRESLCTLGNGYLATRGAAEEADADDRHYPGTYLAGGYDRRTSHVSGREVENEDLVNWPNWLCLKLRPEGGRWLDLREVEVLEYRRELDLARGLLLRRVRFRDEDGRETTLESRRLVSMADPHHAAIELSVRPDNWSGRLEVRSALDGRVRNEGVERYRDLESDHLEPLEACGRGECLLLRVRTLQSEVQMAQVARTRVHADGAPLDVERRDRTQRGYAAQDLCFPVEQGRSTRVEKVVAVYTSRDRAISHPQLEAEKSCGDAPGFEALLEAHAVAWQRIWRRCNIAVEGDERMQLLVRLHIFHLLQTASLHTIDLDVGVPSRGLHGEAYRGHILWDEIFIFPFLNLSIPEITRSLLMYRYRRLPEARRAAREAGLRGAMYPWQSGSNGSEESQRLHLNPRSGRWIPDESRRQRHINATIVYNIWQYYESTEDREFLWFYGAEMILDIARFWASAAVFEEEHGRYGIHGVMGPDEFHDACPGAEEPGLRNNAYTNVMAAWCLWRALDLLARLPADRRAEVVERMRLSDGEIEAWEKISRRLRVCFVEDGVIAQFEGYEKLCELDWERYRAKYSNIQRLDRILEAEGDSVNRYKASKQADVLMLFFLFSAEELEALFRRLGYDFDPSWIPKNVEYYLARTSHGSTLSRVVHSWVLARSDRPRSWDLFCRALESDVADIQGGTTEEGIHLGAMAGSVDLVQRCYTGVEMREDVLWLNPSLPEPMKKLHFRLRYRGRWLRLDLERDRVRVAFERGRDHTARLGIGGQVYEFRPGEARDFRLGR